MPDPTTLHLPALDLSQPKVPLVFAPWPDAVLDTIGHDPRSAYVERFWIVVIGPSAMLLLRLLADELERHPDGFTTTLDDLSRTLGLRYRSPSDSVLVHAIKRLRILGITQLDDGNGIVVRRRIPTLSARQLHRLPDRLRAEHDAWVALNPRRPELHDQRHRARRLALLLLELGDDVDPVERQLHHWGFHPAFAHDAVRWAQAEHKAVTGTGALSNGLLKAQRVGPATTGVARQALAAAPAAGR